MATSTPSKDSTGLMAFWADIEPTQLNRYQQWHNCEHIPERVSIPDFTVETLAEVDGAAPEFPAPAFVADAVVPEVCTGEG